MEKLGNSYYQPENLWKGQKAIKKLRDLSSLKPKVIKSWLGKQAFWQVHLSKPKNIERPHYEVSIPNQLHQFDLLYMPGDKLYGNKYKYILSGIDAASRFKVARPLRTKKAKDVSEMLADIYKVGPLTYPEVFQVDNGGEFKSDVIKLLEKHNVEIRPATTKYKHTHTAFVESLNKILAVNLFKIQDVQELNDPEKVSSTWVKHLYKLVEKLNNTKTQMTGMKPVDAIKLKEIPLIGREDYAPEDKLPEDGLYRYLLQPGEEHGDQKKRATDRIWSKKSYRLTQITEQTNNRVIYFLKDGPGRSFVKEELMQIPEDTELPPDYVKNW
jgi:hypothetical protein